MLRRVALPAFVGLGVALGIALRRLAAGGAFGRRMASGGFDPSTAEDAELEGRIEEALASEGVPRGRYAFAVDGGSVTVRGAPASTEQAESVRRLITSLEGARQVRMEVLPAPSGGSWDRG